MRQEELPAPVEARDIRDRSVARARSDSSQLVTLDRQRMAFIAEAAKRAKANMEPLKYVSMQADAAAQTAFALPMCPAVTHGTDK